MYIIYFLPIEDQNGGTIYEVSTYLLIAFLIWWERDNLADFHMDKSALILILLFRPVQTLILTYWKVESPLVFPSIPSLMIWTASVTLAISLWRGWVKIPRISAAMWSWLVIGFFAGVCVSILENFASFQSILSNDGHLFSLIAKSASLNMIYHLGFAPINEEPVFRGFLWGVLRARKWKEGSILIFQTILFTSAHLYFAKQYPLMFWVFIPAAALLFGVLTMRSRSISPAMLAHGMINGSAYVLAAGLMSGL
jgi:membrane protease YdiL (CAAX protease family)